MAKLLLLELIMFPGIFAASFDNAPTINFNPSLTEANENYSAEHVPIPAGGINILINNNLDGHGSGQGQFDRDQQQICISTNKGCIYPAVRTHDDFVAPGFCSKSNFNYDYIYSDFFDYAYCREDFKIPCFQTTDEYNACQANCKKACSPLCFDCNRDVVYRTARPRTTWNPNYETSDDTTQTSTNGYYTTESWTTPDWWNWWQTDQTSSRQ